MPATRHTRVYVYMFDYHAAFELRGHPQQPRVLRNSMMLLKLLCKNELASPDDFCIPLTAEMKAALEAQTDQFYAHIALGKMLVEDMMPPRHTSPTTTLLAPVSFPKPTVKSPAVAKPAKKFGEWTAFRPTRKPKTKGSYQLTPASTPAHTPESTPNTTPKSSPKCRPSAIQSQTPDATPKLAPGLVSKAPPVAVRKQPIQPSTAVKSPVTIYVRRPRLPPRRFRQDQHKDQARSKAIFDVCEVHRSMQARGHRRRLCGKDYNVRRSGWQDNVGTVM